MSNPVESTSVFETLGDILEERKGAAADSSYVASLYSKGLNKILEKVGEEATETIIAAKDAQHSGDNSDVVYETADLWFHSLVALAQLGERPEACCSSSFSLSSFLPSSLMAFLKPLTAPPKSPPRLRNFLVPKIKITITNTINNCQILIPPNIANASN